MLQWMGGSRRKVTTSRKSTQKRQKQYFEQRKRQRQYQQQTAVLESHDDGTDISGEQHREHRSLDVISLLNLSNIARECRSACPSVYSSHTNSPGRKDLGVNASKREFDVTNSSPIIQSSKVVQPPEFVDFKETRTPLDFQVETASKKKISSSVPDSHTNALNGVNPKQQQWDTTAEPLSVLDLLGDDGLNNNNMEENIVHEAHVAFSIEGLGKVGAETPVHSPQQHSRSFSYGFCSPQKASGKLNLSKKFNSMLDDLEIEDTRMQDIDLPLNSTHLEFPLECVESLSSPKQKSFTCRDTRHCAVRSSKKKRSHFDYKIEDIWDDRPSFQYDGFFDERKHDKSWKTRQNRIDDSTAEMSIYGDYDTSDFAFEGPRLSVRTAEKVRDKFDILGSISPYSKHEISEYDCDFFVSNWSRRPTVERKFDFNPITSQSEDFIFVTEDAKDNSSLQSEESCSSSAVRYQATDDSLSNATSRQHRRRGQSSAFAGSGDKNGVKAFATESKDNAEQENIATGSAKCTNMLDPSRKYQSSSLFQENLETKNNWCFKERSVEVDVNTGSSSLIRSSETKHSRIVTDLWDEDPLIKFPGSKSDIKTDHQGNRYGDESIAFSPSGYFTPVKISAHESSKISKSEFPPDSSFERAPKDSSFTAGSLYEPQSLDLSVKESISKDVEGKVNFKSSNYGTFNLGEETCIRNECLVSEDKVATDTSHSKSNDHKRKEAKDKTVPQPTDQAKTAFLPDVVEETPPSTDIADRSGSTNHVEENHHAADKTSLPYQSGKKENIEDFGPKEWVGNKQKSDHFDSPRQALILQSYVLQFFCVEKRLKC